MYSVDGKGNLLRLEKAAFFPVRQTKGGFVTTRTIEWRTPNETSQVRIAQTGDTHLEFVMRFPPGGDPTKFKLYGLDKAKGMRIVTVLAQKDEMIRKRVESRERLFDFDLKKVSDDVYEFVLNTKLPPGEYVFESTGSTDGFCFGID